MIRTLPHVASLLLSAAVLSHPAFGETAGIEKDQLTLGFIKLTDMAPLAIAKEKGFFEDEGLSVTLTAQSNWKVLLDGVISGELDGAQMLVGQPIAATIGYGTKGALVTPFSMDMNGNAITVSNAVWALLKPGLALGDDGKPVHPISAASLKRKNGGPCGSATSGLPQDRIAFRTMPKPIASSGGVHTVKA